MTHRRILEVGRNCWRIAHADKVAFVIDGENYFRHLHEALKAAQQQVNVLSWDIFSGLKIGAMQGDDRTLAELLNECLEEKTELQAWILSWDFSLMLSMSREWLPSYKLGQNTHQRLTFKLDGRHPLGACHHQKVVIVDNSFAFSGGLDLTRGRWDSNIHQAENPERRKVDGTSGRPYHDCMIAVSGEAAERLNELAYERWRRAGLELPDPPSPRQYWPKGLQIDIEDVRIAISRTSPAFEDFAEVREAEQLILDAIAFAEDYIYIENQYFCSPVVCNAIKKRLSESAGPEVVILLPLETEGWLAQHSLDVIRVKLLRELIDADHEQRLAIYYPFKREAAARELPINLHAKLMVVDDRFARVGSSNFNNRSMGMDTECDVSIECTPEEEETLQAIRQFRNRLLGEHLNVAPEEVQKAVNGQHSLLKGIASLIDDEGERTLKPLEEEFCDYSESVLTQTSLMDPEQPVSVEKLLSEVPDAGEPAGPQRRIAGWVIGIGMLVAWGFLLRYTPLNDWLAMESLTATINRLNENPVAPLVLILCFALASFLMVPVTLLIIAFVIVFDIWLGALYSMIGAMLGAVGAYHVGKLLGKDAVRSMTGDRLERLGDGLRRRGIFTIFFVRIVPVAPFTVINVFAGALQIVKRDFVIGTFLGLIPGIASVALLTNRVQATIESPDPQSVMWLLIAAAVVLTGGFMLSQYLKRLSAN